LSIKIIKGVPCCRPRTGVAGQGRLLDLIIARPQKNRAKPESKRAKRKRGVGKMNFCPLASPPKADNGVGAFPQFLSQEECKTEKFSFP